MKFSMTGEEKVTFIKYKWLLNRGDHMDRFDCTCKFMVNKNILYRTLYIYFIIWINLYLWVIKVYTIYIGQLI